MLKRRVFKGGNYSSMEWGEDQLTGQGPCRVIWAEEVHGIQEVINKRGRGRYWVDNWMTGEGEHT